MTNNKLKKSNWSTKKQVFLFLLFFFLIALVLIGGVIYNNYNIKSQKIKVQDELTSIASVKIDQLSEWYLLKKQTANKLAKNSVLISRIIELKELNSGSAKNNLEDELNLIRNEYSLLGVQVLTENLEILSSTSNLNAIVEKSVIETSLKSISQGEAIVTGLFKCKEHNLIRFDICAPIYRDHNLIAVLVLVIDANDFLYPFIQKWPIHSKTAETLIIRKENDHVLFLNELRHVKGTALTLTIPLTNLDVPAIMAVNGYKGLHEGIDYRNIQVISFINNIPNTPWYFVAKVDKNELYLTVNRISNLTLLIVLFLMIVLLLVFAFTLSMQQKNTYKSLWMAQQEFETTLYSIGDGVITTDEQGRVKNLNKVAEELTGWIERDAINKPISGIFNIINEDTLKPVESPVNKVIEKGQIVGLANHALLISKDGSRIPIADSGAPIVNSEGEIVGVVLVFRDQTEERDHQMILEEQRRQLFTLLSNLPGMAYRCKCNKDWTMELVSKGCINLTGYNEDELNENKIVSYGQLIIEDDRDFVWEQVQNALNTRTNFEFEYRIRTKSNSIKWVWEKGQGIYDEEGNLIALEGFINDIDERKKIESALKKSEQLFQNLTENATVGIFKTDKEGLTTYINPEWKNITGLTYSEAKGNGWLNYVHPDDKNTIAENWNYSIDKNKKSDAEYRFVKTNGEIVWVKGQAVPEYDGHHNLVGYIGTINNITDIKAYENKLKEANTLLHALIDNIPDAIYLKDIQGRKVLVNKADLINIGIDDEKDVLGKSDFDVFPKEIAEEFWKVDQEVMNKGEALLDVEEELINNNNERKWLSTSKIPYKNDKNEIIGLIGIGHDISYKKKLHEELVYAKNKAEESDQLKTSFLANMSHEIRTPLNSILGFTNLITESDDLNKNERTEYSTIIQKSSDSLLQIINDIIDISSLETGQLAINNSEVKVNNIVNMLEIEYSRRVSDLKIKDIEIKSLIVDEDLSMITDSNRLNQIFINLLTNALKFTSSGSIVFGIEKYDKKKVYFKVQDTGIGIEPHSQKIIFDRFRQAENNNVRKFGGNGLGLSIVNNLVELMGGNISLESELGKGSVFRFNLPFNPPQ